MIYGYRSINTVRYLSPSRSSWSGTSALPSPRVKSKSEWDKVGNTNIIRKPQGDHDSRTCLAAWQQGRHPSTSETITKHHPKKKSRPDSLVLSVFVPTIHGSGRLPNSPSIASRANPLCADTLLLFSSFEPTHSNCSQATLDEDNSLWCQTETSGAGMAARWPRNSICEGTRFQ